MVVFYMIPVQKDGDVDQIHDRFGVVGSGFFTNLEPLFFVDRFVQIVSGER